MNRRELVRMLPVVLLPAYAQTQATSHRELNVVNSFRIAIPEDEFVQDFVSTDNHLYFLVGSRSVPAWSLVSTAPEGAANRLWALPGGRMYAEVVLADDGRLVARYLTPRANESGLDLLGADGAILRSMPVKTAPSDIVAICAVSDEIVLLNRDGSFDLMDPATSEMRRMSSTFPDPNFSEMRRAGNRSAVVLERTDGRVGLLNLEDDTIHLASMEAPEIARSLDRFHGWIAKQKAGGIDRVAPPLLITAWNVDRAGSVYAIIAPIDQAKGYLVMRSDLSGRIDARFSLRMPSATARKTLPHHLGILGSKLALVYWDGNVDVYDVSDRN
jgi:hypothetical protein